MGPLKEKHNINTSPCFLPLRYLILLWTLYILPYCDLIQVQPDLSIISRSERLTDWECLQLCTPVPPEYVCVCACVGVCECVSVCMCVGTLTRVTNAGFPPSSERDKGLERSRWLGDTGNWTGDKETMRDEKRRCSA